MWFCIRTIIFILKLRESKPLLCRYSIKLHHWHRSVVMDLLRFKWWFKLRNMFSIFKCDGCIFINNRLRLDKFNRQFNRNISHGTRRIPTKC